MSLNFDIEDLKTKFNQKRKINFRDPKIPTFVGKIHEYKVEIYGFI